MSGGGGGGLIETALNPIGAIAGSGSIASKIADPVPFSFIPGQTGISGVLNDPFSGIQNAFSPGANIPAVKDLEKNLLGFSLTERLQGTEETEVLPDPLGDEFTGDVVDGAFDGTQEKEKRIQRAAGGRRRRGFSGGSTSLSAPSSSVRTLLGS